MLKVKQFRYGADNLGYLVYGAESAMAIDGGAADEILAFLAEHQLTLKYVANTHDHQDHTSGNGALLAGTQARLLTGADLPDGDARSRWTGARSGSSIPPAIRRIRVPSIPARP